MAGIPVTFSWSTADKIRWYAPHPQAVLGLWLPTNWAAQARTSVIEFTYGGGWDTQDFWRVTKDNTYALLPGEFDPMARLALAAGFAVAFTLWPNGWQVEALSGSQPRRPPCSRFPDIDRIFAHSTMMLRTWAAASTASVNITGDPAHSLAIDETQYHKVGVSSGGINLGWAAFQHDGAIPYHPISSPAHRFDRWMPRFSHRLGTVSLFDSIGDTRLLQTGGSGVSGNLMTRMGNQERYPSSPALADVPLEVLADSSYLPVIRQDHLPNRKIAVFGNFPGSYGTGDIMNNPAMTKEAFEALALLGQPITGNIDVHETGYGWLLESALRAIAAAEGKTWDQTRHRIYWGNPTSNPQGLTAIPFGSVDTLPVTWFDWLTNIAGAVPYV